MDDNKMGGSIPFEKDIIKERLIRHLRWRGATDTVAVLWHGYLAALLEWGPLELKDYEELKKLLPLVGYKERFELFIDRPIPPEKALEYAEHFSKYQYELPAEVYDNNYANYDD